MTTSKPIPLKEAETAALIRASRGRGLSLAFGTGGAALKPDESPWAVPILESMRRIILVDGAGI